MSVLTYKVLTGNALADVLDDVARLRIDVFREFPYLYDGDLDYERRYIESYRSSSGAIVVCAFAGERLVGASTGTPLADHDAAFREPVEAAGVSPGNTFYCAESVLLRDYRGQGAGHAFFDERERHARSLGLKYSCFCAVKRPADHPARPAGYRPLDGFWRSRGYRALDGATARFGWKEVGQDAETTHRLQFWHKAL